MGRERPLIEALGRRIAALGDDAAMVDPPAGTLLLCADAAVAGLHADLGLVGFDDLGWRALAACVSDVAAMGGRPRWGLVTVSGELDPAEFERLYDGLLAAAAAYGCEVVGGDITGGPGLVVSVSVVGECDGVPVTRGGARAGDVLFVTGPLGSAAEGLAYLRGGDRAGAESLVEAHARPRARVEEGTAARRAGASAMIDLSDGLATDVRHLAEASGVGVVLDRVPAAPGVGALTGDAQRTALGGGDDYELLFAAPDPARVRQEFHSAGLRPPLAVGRCTGDPAERRLGGGPLPEAGWEHRW